MCVGAWGDNPTEHLEPKARAKMAKELPDMYDLLIALDAYMFSHDGYGTRAQGHGPGPIPIMAGHMYIKGNE